ncbi:MAG: glycosyltransferase [Bacteroidota bacterium]
MKVAFITSRFPYPLEKGDKLRAFQQIKQLAGLGHEVHLFAVSDVDVLESSRNALLPYCKSMQIHNISKLTIIKNISKAYLSGASVQSRYFYSSSFHIFLKDKIDFIKPDIVYFQLVRTALYADGLVQYPKVLDFQDAFSLGMKQRVMQESGFLKQIFMRESKLLSSFEKICLNEFDAFSIISESDKRHIDPENQKNIRVIPNAVDLSFFKPSVIKKTFDLLFVGNMGYKPNIEAARYLVNEIMPIVWKRLPSATLLLAGANPSKLVKSFESDRIKVSGWVDDIRTCYNQSRVFIAPMVSGTGLQNKILEALAMGLPSVTTPISAVPLAPGFENHVKVGKTAEELASYVILLLNDYQSDIFKETGPWEYIAEHYDTEKIGLDLESLLVSATSKKIN